MGWYRRNCSVRCTHAPGTAYVLAISLGHAQLSWPPSTCAVFVCASVVVVHLSASWSSPSCQNHPCRFVVWMAHFFQVGGASEVGPKDSDPQRPAQFFALTV